MRKKIFPLWQLCALYSSALVVLLANSAVLQAQEALPTPAKALERLKEGNSRFVSDKPAAKYTGSQQRTALAKGQRPFAVVLACADSRVPPELVFDQGLGDLFVVRVAGNVTDPDVLGSIEYAVEHLQTPLVVVLGHEGCGAVKAALSGEKFSGNLGQLITQVHVGTNLPKDPREALAAAIRANILYHARELTENSSALKELVSSGRVVVVTGIYALQSGQVTWLDDEKTNGRKDSK